MILSLLQRPYYLLPFAFLLASIANAARGSEELSIDRRGFGTATLPVWSELSPFEQETITRVDRPGAPDPNTLLAFYLLAAGNVRHQWQFSHYRRQIDNWLAANQHIADIDDEKKRGARLHLAMHQDFFASTGRDSSIKGYDLDQSRLSTLLDTKSFNCISSSLLYIVLAGKLDLDAKGVVIPSHAFVQLKLRNGDIVEIETTSRNGYDLEHDEDFYDSASGNWFADRQLDAPTYAQYQARSIVSPQRLGLENMWAQHTHPERMSYTDRMRLAELRGHLQPADLNAQKNRLFFYTREFTYLHDRRDYTTLSALYEQIGPYIQQLSSDDWSDKDFDNLLAWVKSGMAVAYLHTDTPGKGLQLARQQLRSFDNSISDAGGIRSNLFFVIANYAKQKIAAKQFDRARAVFDGYELACLENRACESAFGKLYADWAQQHWNKKEWGKAIALYSAYLKLNGNSDTAQIFQANLESAYLNWANTALYDENWSVATRRLGDCLERLPEAQRCEGQLRKLRQASPAP